MKLRNWIAPLALLAASAQIAVAQGTLAVAPAFQGYKFGDGFGASSATLMLIPIAYEQSVSRSLSFDLYSAYARGDVHTSTTTSTLQGIVDTRVRANLSVTPWATITAALNLPTGNASHDAEQLVVATTLSTELLGFREALWGTGFGATTGIATASRWGNTGLGFGASYRLASEFEPTDSALKYTPGNEARIRLALDRDIGANKLTLGVTFQNYSEDKVDGRNLFAPGNRWRGDLTYSFRTGPASTWTLFATDVWRENGDVTLGIVSGSGQQIGDTTFLAGQQNLTVLGIAGASRLMGLDARPSADFRLLTRESGQDEGWLAGLGSEFPVRRGNMDLIPSVRVSYGQLEGASTDTRYRLLGGEIGITLRWGGR